MMRAAKIASTTYSAEAIYCHSGMPNTGLCNSTNRSKPNVSEGDSLFTTTFTACTGAFACVVTVAVFVAVLLGWAYVNTLHASAHNIAPMYTKKKTPR